MTFKYPSNKGSFALALILTLLVAPCFAQEPAPPTATPSPAPVQTPRTQTQLPSDSPARIVLNPTLVLLPVTVKDRSGNLVPDLKKDEFRIFEDDIEQQIDYFSAEAFPLSLVVLIDNDLKSKDADQVEPSLRSIVGGMSTNDEAFICRFDQFFYEGKGFTKDQDKLITELRRTGLDLSSRASVAPPASAEDTRPVGPAARG